MYCRTFPNQSLNEKWFGCLGIYFMPGVETSSYEMAPVALAPNYKDYEIIIKSLLKIKKYRIIKVKSCNDHSIDHMEFRQKNPNSLSGVAHWNHI
jgi:hypothetical protein